MIARSIVSPVIAAVVAVLVLVGCDRDTSMLEPAPFPDDAEVFLDAFGPSVQYQAFGSSKVDALGIDLDVKYAGTHALKFTVPSVGDPAGTFAGGAFVASVPRDLSGFDALTFWTKASVTAEIGVIGFGNDNTGTSSYVTELKGLPVTTAWQKVVVPIPDPDKLVEERGLFQLAVGAMDGSGFEIWFDEVKFEKLGIIAQTRPAINTKTVELFLGGTDVVDGTTVTFDVAGRDQTVEAAPAYYTFTSSDPAVATVDANGRIVAVGLGTAEITATLDSEAAAGTVTVNVVDPPPGPATAAPTPTIPEADVISLFSNAYTDVQIDTWSADWDVADVADIQVAGDDVKFYTNLLFAGVTFESAQIDASAMTHFRMDLWTPDDTAPPATFAIELNDFGPDGAFNTGDEASHRLVIQGAPLESGTWVTLDIPLQNFTGLTQRANLAQLVFVTDPGPETVYIDNVFFYAGDLPATPEPTTPAPTPTQPASDVISLYSNAYTDVQVDTWSAEWDVADVADVQVAGDDVKLYTGLQFAGVEFTMAPLNVVAMTHFHMDIWTPDPTALPAAFRIKLVDFGPDGMFNTGDESEDELTFDATTNPALMTENWVSFDIPLDAFANMTGRTSIAQMIISGDPNTVYVDNVYFYNDDGGNTATEPTTPAPTPTQPASDVISLYSNAYTDVSVDTWSAAWDSADLEDVVVAGDDMKKYTNLVFAGVEFVSEQIDATNMTHFRLDMWTPDPTEMGNFFRIELVDFGPDGAFDGGDDTKHQLAFDATTNPPLVTGNWVSFDIPLSDFTGLTTQANLAQMIIQADPGPNTVFIDNVYFYGDGGTAVTKPAAPAPTPTQPESDVISLFSNAYTDVSVDTWSAAWDNADLEDTQVVGNDVKLYTNLAFAGIEFTSQTVDASAMTNFRMDLWTPDPTELPAVFRIKLVDFGPDGMFGTGDEAEHELTFDAMTNPPLVTGSWVSFDIPLDDFTGLTTRGNLAQLVLAADPGPNTVYVDNVYFYGDGGTAVTKPAAPAPTPTQPESDVISLFSNAYTDVSVDTWSAAWDNADLEDTQVVGDDVKLYTNLAFAGIEFTSAPVDASAMTNFRMDLWTPDPTELPAAFRIKLVDFGPDGMFGTGDESEDELTFDAMTNPPLVTGSWVSFDIPLDDFANMTGRTSIAQMIISGDPNTVYVDNVYFYGDGGTAVTKPASAAPAPSFPEGDVISLFSNPYTDVTVDTWSAAWDNADLEDTQIAGDDVKLYTNLAFAGIEFTSATVDATDMTHLYMSFWTPDPTELPAAFRIKLVDFGADGAFQGGDDVEHELTLDATTTPALSTGNWVTFDIPFAEFTGLTTRGHLAQMIISGDPNTVYLDNVLLHK